MTSPPRVPRSRPAPLTVRKHPHLVARHAHRVDGRRIRPAARGTGQGAARRSSLRLRPERVTPVRRCAPALRGSKTGTPEDRHPGRRRPERSRAERRREPRARPTRPVLKTLQRAPDIAAGIRSSGHGRSRFRAGSIRGIRTQRGFLLYRRTVMSAPCIFITIYFILRDGFLTDLFAALKRAL